MVLGPPSQALISGWVFKEDLSQVVDSKLVTRRPFCEDLGLGLGLGLGGVSQAGRKAGVEALMRGQTWGEQSVKKLKNSEARSH